MTLLYQAKIVVRDDKGNVLLSTPMRVTNIGTRVRYSTHWTVASGRSWSQWQDWVETCTRVRRVYGAHCTIERCPYETPKKRANR